MGSKKTAYNPDKENEIFAIKLREIAKEKKATQQALADYIGKLTGETITRQSVGQWFIGATRPPLRTVPLIAKFFGVSTDYLLTETETKTSDELIRAAVDNLGITEESAENIKAITQSGLDMNLLLESNELKGVVEMLNKVKTISVGRRYRAARIEGGFEEILDMLSGDLYHYFRSAVDDIERFALSGGDVAKDYVAFSPEDLSYDNFSKIIPSLFINSGDRNYDMMLSLAEFQLIQKKFNKLVENIKNDTSTDEEQFAAFDDDIAEMLENGKSGTVAAIEECLKQILAANQKELRALKGTEKKFRQESINELEQLIAFFHNHIRKE